LNLPQRFDIAFELFIRQRGGFGDRQFRAYVAREVFILGLPAVGLRIQEDGAFEVGQNLGRTAVQQAGEEIDVHAATFVQRDEQRLLGRADLRDGSVLLDGAFAKDGSLGGTTRFRVVMLEREQQRQIRVPAEGDHIGPIGDRPKRATKLS